jgi:malate dehydrogenase (oxaloacetate-decarboxylating)(NADP+)
MAIFATQASRVTDEMFIEAAASIADQVAPELLERGLLYPLQANILETEIQTAARVAKLVFDSNLARVPRPADMVACALRGMKQRRCSAPSPTTRSRS